MGKKYPHDDKQSWPLENGPSGPNDPRWQQQNLVAPKTDVEPEKNKKKGESQ